MAINSRATLQSGIADFLNRDDLTDVIPTFIDLAEGQINRDVRHWKMETTAQKVVVDDVALLPSDWLETKNVQYYPDINDYTKFHPLEYLSQNALDERKMNSENIIGEPQYYTFAVNGGTGMYILFPQPKAREDDRIVLSYLQNLNLAGTSWLLTDYPDVYLYGSLIHAAIYLKDDERLALFSQMYGAAVQRVNASSDEAEYKHDRLRTRKLGLDTSRSKQPNHVRWS